MLTIHVLPRRLKEFLLTHPLYKSPAWQPRPHQAQFTDTSSGCPIVLLFVAPRPRSPLLGLVGSVFVRLVLRLTPLRNCAGFCYTSFRLERGHFSSVGRAGV